MTSELAEICGIHAGDGHLRKRGNKFELDITGNFKERIYYDAHVIPLFNNEFNLMLKGKLYSKGTYGFIISKKKICALLNELGFPYGKKCDIVRVPKSILNNETKEIQAAFLRGFLDTDGHLGFRRCWGKYSEFKRKHSHYPTIYLTTTSGLLAKDLSKMLQTLGIKHFVYSNSPKRLNESKVHKIIINGVERLERWMKFIGTNNPSKLSRYLIWKKFGHCPTNTNLRQREDILKGELDIYSVGL